MNWRLAAIPATLIPIMIIAIQFDIKPEDVLAIGFFPFVGAVVAMMIKLGLQGIKFAYIARRYLGNFDSVLKLTGFVSVVSLSNLQLQCSLEQNSL